MNDDALCWPPTCLCPVFAEPAAPGTTWDADGPGPVDQRLRVVSHALVACRQTTPSTMNRVMHIGGVARGVKRTTDNGCLVH